MGDSNSQIRTGRMLDRLRKLFESRTSQTTVPHPTPIPDSGWEHLPRTAESSPEPGLDDDALDGAHQIEAGCTTCEGEPGNCGVEQEQDVDPADPGDRPARDQHRVSTPPPVARAFLPDEEVGEVLDETDFEDLLSTQVLVPIQPSGVQEVVGQHEGGPTPVWEEPGGGVARQDAGAPQTREDAVLLGEASSPEAPAEDELDAATTGSWPANRAVPDLEQEGHLPDTQPLDEYQPDVGEGLTDEAPARAVRMLEGLGSALETQDLPTSSYVGYQKDVRGGAAGLDVLETLPLEPIGPRAGSQGAGSEGAARLVRFTPLPVANAEVLRGSTPIPAPMEGVYAHSPPPISAPERVQAVPVDFPRGAVGHEGAYARSGSGERAAGFIQGGGHPEQGPYPEQRSTSGGEYGNPYIQSWEDQPTELFQGRRKVITPVPGSMAMVQRTATPDALMVRASTGDLEIFADLLGGPLDASREILSIDLPANPMLPALLRPDSLAANRYRVLGNRIGDAAWRDYWRIIAITSAGEGDGKSVTALNLALVLSEEPTRRVGLVECNLRRPSFGSMLGLSDELGLVSIFRRQATLTESMVCIADRDLYLLPAGVPYPRPSEILQSPLFSAIVKRLEMDLNIVIIDAPPVLPVADVNLLTRLVDRFIFVVRAGHTRRSAVAEALQQLDESKLLGQVLNAEEL